MICPKCGSEIQPGGCFCVKCGTKVAESELTQTTQKINTNVDKFQQIPSQGFNVSSANPVVGNTPSKNKLAIPIIIAGCVTAFFLMIVVIALIANHKTTVNLDPYVSVQFNGYDTLGQANLIIDWDSFRKDYKGKIKFRKKELKFFVEKMSYEQQLTESWGFNNSAIPPELIEAEVRELMRAGGEQLIPELFEGSLDRNSKLHNGDTVNFSWNDDYISELEVCMKCKFVYSKELPFTVSDLTEIGSFDPFENVTVSYSGTAPNGQATLEGEDNSYGEDIYYEMDNWANLSNGDIIVVTAKVRGSEESFVEKYGKLPNPAQKEFSVEGLSGYASSASQIPDSTMKEMQKKAEEVIKKDAERFWKEEATPESIDYIGNYFLIDEIGNFDKNKCYLIYKIDAKMSMEDDGSGKMVDQNTDIYYYVMFRNLINESDGTMDVDIENYKITPHQFRVETDVLWSKFYERYWLFDFNGYESLEEMFEDDIEDNGYSIEKNIIE